MFYNTKVQKIMEGREMIPTAEVLDKQIQLAKLQLENDPRSLQMKLVSAEQAAKFALTPVGQELKRFETLQRMGQMYAQATIVPDTYKGNVANCAIALDMATRMNANPVMVMQNLYIVHGNPSWSSKFLIATINTCGRFKTLKYKFFEEGTIGKVEYWENEWSYENGQRVKKNVKKAFDGSKIPNIVCVAYTTEEGSDDILESTPVSCRMAVEEGWWTKNQSKWPTMTKLMLSYRAAAFWQRMYAPEISMGFMTQEEAEDMIDVSDVEYKEVKPDSRKSRIAEIAAQMASSQDGSFDPETGEVIGDTPKAEENPESEGVASQGQSKPMTDEEKQQTIEEFLNKKQKTDSNGTKN